MNISIMKHRKLFKTVLLCFSLLFGINVSAQQIWEVPMTYYKNGQKRHVIIKEGKKVNKATTIGENLYYDNGKLWQETRLQSSGKYLQKMYYKNEQLGAIGIQKRTWGAKNGEWKSYYSNGQLWQTVSFDEYGFSEGDYKEYYPTGILKATGRVASSKGKGIWTFYNENGEVEKNEDFGEGKEISRTDVDEESKDFDLLK